MQKPEPALIEEAINTAMALRKTLAEMERVGGHGESPEKVKAEVQKAERLFRDLHDATSDRLLGPFGVSPEYRARLAAYRNSEPGWAKVHDSLMRTIVGVWEGLPILALQKLRTDIIPAIWPLDSQEIMAGLTVGELKSAMALFQECKESDLAEQMSQEALRASRDIELALCPFEEFFDAALPRLKGFRYLLRAVASADSAELEGGIHLMEVVARKLEAGADLSTAAKNPVSKGRTSETADKARKLKMTREEANVRARQLLGETPTWDWTARKLAQQIPCSLGWITTLPMWRKYHEKRQELKREGTIKTVSLTDTMEAVLGTGEKDEQLNQLIAEQEGDEREDARQAKLYLSSNKKPQRRDS